MSSEVPAATAAAIAEDAKLHEERCTAPSGAAAKKAESWRAAIDALSTELALCERQAENLQLMSKFGKSKWLKYLEELEATAADESRRADEAERQLSMIHKRRKVQQDTDGAKVRELERELFETSTRCAKLAGVLAAKRQE